MTAQQMTKWFADFDDCPSLQMLVELTGRRHAASIGEKYVEDPFKRPPDQGGYQHLTPEDWSEWDRAVAEWQQSRRDQLERERGIGRRRRGAP